MARGSRSHSGLQARQAVIVSAVRTPIGLLNGVLSSLSAPRLGSLVITEALRRVQLNPDSVERVILGNVLSAGLGQAPARQAALGAGLPQTVGCLTINKVCGSGLKAVMLAAQAIACGEADVVVAGGRLTEAGREDVAHDDAFDRVGVQRDSTERFGDDDASESRGR